MIPFTVLADTDYERIINQPPVIKIEACQALAEDKTKFIKCFSPFLKTADCRDRTKRSLHGKELEASVYEKEFMIIFNDCYSGKSE